MSEAFFFIFLYFFFFFSFLTMKTNSTPLSMCGDTEIRYPFWLQNTTNTSVDIRSCGYTGFCLKCTSSNTSILFHSNQHFLIKSIDYSNYTVTLVNVDVTSNSTFVKMSYGPCGYNNTSEFLCFCEDDTVTNGDCKDAKKDNHSRMLKIEIAVPIVTLLTSLAIVYSVYKKHSNARVLFQHHKKSNDDKKLEIVIRQRGSHIPRRYNFSEIIKITNSFDDKIGEGGHGNVYKGYLHDGHPVAVKLIKVTKLSGEEFLNEIASISATSHVNVVSLLGFCLDGKNYALIFEFMLNGSLEKHIHQNSNTLTGVEKLYKIAIGVARGLEYLHNEHHNSMVHFDIKPHNILLDEDFCPKISDFGLAIFCDKKESILSKLHARGTIGYIAPELFNPSVGVVSCGTDVYSFGMMILEMVGARNNPTTGNNSEAYFPDWVYKRVACPQAEAMENGEMNEIERKMILVGLWCIQIDPLHRPTIEKAIEMLEGSIEYLEMPPKPEFHFLPAFEKASQIATSKVSNTSIPSTTKEPKVVVTTRYSGSYSCDLSWS